MRRVSASSYLTADQPRQSGSGFFYLSFAEPSLACLASRAPSDQATKQRLAKVVPGPRPGYSTESTPGPWMQPDGYAFHVDSLI